MTLFRAGLVWVILVNFKSIFEQDNTDSCLVYQITSQSHVLFIYY